MHHPLSAVDLVPPEGWIDASTLSFVAPPDAGLRANLLVTHERTNDADVTAFAVRQGVELAGALRDYQRYRFEPATIGGREGVRAEYSFTNQGGEVVHQHVAYVLRENLAYVLVMSCEAAANEKGRALFDWVLASYKVV